jgi:predicted transglutaminase-like cysteine proteinase
MATARGLKLLMLTGFTALSLISAAQASQTGPHSMQVGAITSQPIGHYEFCRAHADECNIKTSSSVAPRVTDFGWQIIREVNLQVNRSVMPMTDQDLYGKDEVWAYPTDAGDCEDFVLQKRKMLIEKGFSVADLLITVVRKPDGEGHAVLTMRTADGDYILDNLEDDVKLWTDTPYTYLKRQASFNTGRWVTIETSPDVMVGALR